jgi:PHD/YefM family antitoxin component YafN of YafNO toxin-antitoxin module
MYKTTSVTDLRHHLAEMIDSLGEENAVMVVRHSQAAAYLVSPEYFEGLVDQLENLMDTSDMQAAIEDYKKGDAVDGEEVFRRLGL